MLSMTTGVLPEGFTTEDVEKEIDAGIAETHMQAEQFTTTEIDLATGWPTQWWSRRRVTITMDEGEMQTIGEKGLVPFFFSADCLIFTSINRNSG